MALQIVLFCSLLAATLAQYPRHIAPEAPPPRRSAPAPEPRDVEPLYRPAPRQRSPVFNPAAVHYVNIGTELQGDYKFGYDTGKIGDDQSFREETRLPDGSVKGAYGYVDASGKQRIVKYSAGKDGYKVESDAGAEGNARAKAHAAPAPQHAQPAPAAYSPPQQAYRPPPQQAYNPPQEIYSQPRRTYNPPQEIYNEPQPAPRPVYRPPSQQTYNPPQSYNPPSRPASPPVYSSAPQQAQRPGRSQRPAPKYDYDYDYNSPDNELNEPRVDVPIDTTLFSYNIGINPSKS